MLRFCDGLDWWFWILLFFRTLLTAYSSRRYVVSGSLVEARSICGRLLVGTIKTRLFSFLFSRIYRLSPWVIRSPWIGWGRITSRIASFLFMLGLLFLFLFSRTSRFGFGKILGLLLTGILLINQQLESLSGLSWYIDLLLIKGNIDIWEFPLKVRKGITVIPETKLYH